MDRYFKYEDIASATGYATQYDCPTSWPTVLYESEDTASSVDIVWVTGEFGLASESNWLVGLATAKLLLYDIDNNQYYKMNLQDADGNAVSSNELFLSILNHSDFLFSTLIQKKRRC